MIGNESLRGLPVGNFPPARTRLTLSCMSAFATFCSDFCINQKIALKMDLPEAREPTLELFDRLRRQLPRLTRVRRVEGEVALESAEDEQDFLWVALRQTSIRSGHVNPKSTDDGYKIHRAVLETAPWFLSMSPLDIDHIELVFGFDIETASHRDGIVYEALLAKSPLGSLLDCDHDHPIDVQPFVGISLTEGRELQASFEVKTRPHRADTKHSSTTDPISVYLTVRRNGPLSSLDELPTIFATLCGHAERLAEQRAIPHLVMPIWQAISAS